MIVLVVEDSNVAGLATELKLAGRGYTVEWAADWRTALVKIPVVKPDAILLDLHLPDVPSGDVGGMVESAKGSCKRLVVTTALRGPVVESLKEAHPGVLFLEKPVTIEELGDVLGAWQ